MKRRILLIGIGGIGSKIVDFFAARKHSEEKQFFSLAFDTDVAALRTISSATTVSLASGDSFDTVVKRLGEENVRAWCRGATEVSGRIEYGQELGMERGSNQFRFKAVAAFANFLNSERKTNLDEILDKVFVLEEDTQYEVYIVASIAGGTGSGLFLPITLYIEQYALSKECSARFYAMLSYPESILSDDIITQKIKSEANAYSALSELFEWSEAKSEGKAQPRFPFLDTILTLPEKCNDMTSGEMSPFTRVYFVGKVAGVSSADSYSCYISALLDLIDQDYEPQTLGEASLCVEMSFSELVYPIDSVKNYIVNRLAFEQLDKWLKLFKTVIKPKTSLEQGNLTRCESFSHQLLCSLKKYESEVFEQLSDLQPQKNDSIIFDEKMLSEYLDTFVMAAKERFEEKAELFAEEKAEFRKKRWKTSVFDSKNKRKAKKELLSELISRCGVTLANNSEKFGTQVCSELIKNMDEVFGSASQECEASVLTSLRLDELHPLGAIIRLCSLQELVNLKREDENIRKLVKDKNETDSDCFRRAASSVHSRITELWNKCAKSDDYQKAKSWKSIFAELDRISSQLYGDLDRLSLSLTFSMLEWNIERLIQKYIELLRACVSVHSDFSEIVNDALAEKSSDGSYTVYVGASKKSKEIAYMKFLRNQSCDVLGNTEENQAILMKDFCRAVFDGHSFLQSQEYKNTAREFLKKVVCLLGENFSESSYCKELENKTILEALFQDVNSYDAAVLTFAKTLGKIGRTSHINKAETNIKTYQKMTVVVSQASAERMLEYYCERNFNVADAQSAVERFLMDSMCMDAEYVIDESFSGRRLLVVNCIDSLRKVQTDDGYKLCLPHWEKSYRDANSLAVKYDTTMWYSHVFCNAEDTSEDQNQDILTQSDTEEPIEQSINTLCD